MKRKIPATILLVMFAGIAVAQAPAIKRTLLQKGDVDATREVVLGMAEIPAGGAAGRHTHNGPETGYILEGSAMMEIEGEVPKMLKAGDSYFIPAGKVHDAKAHGGATKVLATYVVEKGKPLATPAP
ncbi:MAG: cupin domain-containing protein [Betaproteobacteria bacterium]|nr:cupin domain-containing protein [Betaproteobacteria bacterium]